MSIDKVSKAKQQTTMEAQENVKSKSTFREYAEAIIMALVLALFIRTFIVQAFKIPSGSMIPRWISPNLSGAMSSFLYFRKIVQKILSSG